MAYPILHVWRTKWQFSCSSTLQTVILIITHIIYTSYTYIHQHTQCNPIQHRALDSVGWGAALLGVRLLFGTLSPVLFMLGEPVSGWFGFRLPFSATVRSPCLWGSFCVGVGVCDGDAWLEGFRTIGWITNGPGLLSLSPSASGSWGLFLFSYLFHRPYPARFMTHTQHEIADLCICVFAVFSSSCFVFVCWFFVLYFSELHQSVSHCVFVLELCPVNLMFSSIFSFSSSLSAIAFLYYTCTHILWTLMEMNK